MPLHHPLGDENRQQPRDKEPKQQIGRHLGNGRPEIDHQAQKEINLEQRIMNPAKGPLRLLNNGHRVPQLINYSFPNPSDSNAAKAESLNLLQTTLSNMAIGYAAREFAKQNMKELTVEATVGGHYNEAGLPYVADTVYDVDFDRGGVKEAMYLHSVHYSLGEDGGQFTRLEFCKLYTSIVANNTLAGSATSQLAGAVVTPL